MSVPRLAPVKDPTTDQNFRLLAGSFRAAEVVLGSEFGISPGNADAGLAKACATLKDTGKTLYLPGGNYKITKPFAVQGFKIAGQGVYDELEVIRFGTVFSLEGELESTASDVCTLSGGGWVSGIVWYYPKEKVTNSSPAITATGYCVSLNSTNPRQNSRCFDNVFVNAPHGVKNHQGWSKVHDNKFSCTKSCIRDEEESAEHSFFRNEITPGNWEGLYGSALGKYIGLNGIAFDLAGTLGPFTDNTIFGYNEGFRFSGYSQFVHICGGLVDGTRYCTRFLPGHGPTDVVFTGVTFGSAVTAGVGGSRDGAAVLESNVANIGKPSLRANIVFNACIAQGANGDLIQVSSPGGEEPLHVSINGGSWLDPGRFTNSYQMTVSEVSGTFTESVTSNDGDKITGGTSGATAFVRRLEGGILYIDIVTGEFKAAEKITGSKSGATAKVGAVSQMPVYRVVRFNDPAAGSLSVQNADMELSAYVWAGGLYMIEGGTFRALGNNFFSSRTSTNACIRVDTAERFVQLGNVSTIPGEEHKDLEEVGPIAHAVSADSSFSRP